MNPVFHFTGFTAAQLGQVKLNGVALSPNLGYFATVDAASHSVWVTLNGKVNAPVSLHLE